MMSDEPEENRTCYCPISWMKKKSGSIKQFFIQYHGIQNAKSKQTKKRTINWMNQKWKKKYLNAQFCSLTILSRVIQYYIQQSLNTFCIVGWIKWLSDICYIACIIFIYSSHHAYIHILLLGPCIVHSL